MTKVKICQVVRTSIFFFFNDTATTEIYTLSLHDALPIYVVQEAPDGALLALRPGGAAGRLLEEVGNVVADRKSTRLNSSHLVISYAVFCLKKKKINHTSLARVTSISLVPSRGHTITDDGR